jgi:hypothetical protein
MMGSSRHQRNGLRNNATTRENNPRKIPKNTALMIVTMKPPRTRNGQVMGARKTARGL